MGPTRANALRELEMALVDTEAAGSVTNVDFLIALTRHEGFGKGDVDTGLIERDLDALIAAAELRSARHCARCGRLAGWLIRRSGAA